MPYPFCRVAASVNRANRSGSTLTCVELYNSEASFANRAVESLDSESGRPELNSDSATCNGEVSSEMLKLLCLGSTPVQWGDDRP